MLIRIYSIVRFIFTLILLGTVTWFSISTLNKFQTRSTESLSPISELIQATKDGQINLEKYRQFEQKVQLDAVAASVDLAEKKLNDLVRNDVFKKPAISQVIESSRNLFKSEKSMVAYLKMNHIEEAIPNNSISTIGELRTEIETSADLGLALQKLSLAEIGVQKTSVLNQSIKNLIIALVFAFLLYVFEVILSFLLKPKKPAIKIATPTPVVAKSPKIEDMLVLNQKFQRVEETVEDMGERISLMAFNALLEATRAGEAGKGFKIVAEELKRLADRSVQSAGNVKKILGETSDLLSNADATKS